MLFKNQASEGVGFALVRTQMHTPNLFQSIYGFMATMK